MSLQRARQLIEDERATKSGTLDLTGLGLNHVPLEVAELTHLTGLKVEYEWPENLPTDLSRLENLTSLSISSSRSAPLPSWITRLNKLRELEFVAHDLTEVDPDVYNLPELRKLSLGKGLSRLPAGIGRCKTLRQLYLG